MAERRQLWLGRAVVRREMPGKVNWLSHLAEEGLALVGDGPRIGVLVAHHEDCLTVDSLLKVQCLVASLQVIDSGIDLRQLLGVGTKQVADLTVKSGVDLQVEVISTQH